MSTRIGLIAGSGQLPAMFASAAREQALSVVAVAHQGETDPGLESLVDSFSWVRVGQLHRIVTTLRAAGIDRAVMAGAIGKLKALSEARPDRGALSVMFQLRTLGDDELLRAIARYFETHGIEIVSATEFLPRAMAPEGLLAGPALSSQQNKDVELGLKVAELLGRADVGQTVVVRQGTVLAMEAAEGTDETIRRGGQLGGRGSVVVKRCKPGQDLRFDLPAIGPHTMT